MKIKTHHLFLLIILSISACTDILESDLGDEKIVLTAPSDSARNDKSSQTFLWEDLREDKEIDLEYYNLQIAEPSFDNANRFVLDTNLTSNSYTYTLVPGQYQWRVRAENLNTKTPYTTYNLKVDSLFDLTNAELILLSPVDGNVERIPNPPSKNIKFQWVHLSGADYYIFQLVAGSFNGEKEEIIYDSTNQVSVTPKITREKFDSFGKRTGGADTYEWRVIATNIKTRTSTYSISTFTVDTTKNSN